MKADIKAAIKRRGYTITAVAEALGITKQTLSNTLRRNPGINTLEAIADAIGCTLPELLADTTTPPPHAITCPHCGASLTVTLS